MEDERDSQKQDEATAQSDLELAENEAEEVKGGGAQDLEWGTRKKRRKRAAGSGPSGSATTKPM